MRSLSNWYRVTARFFVLSAFLLTVADTASAITVKLAWDASAGATGYKVYKGTSAGNYETTPVATVNAPTTTFTYSDSSVSNVTLHFAVKAFNAGGDSGFSNNVVETPPSVPTGLAVNALSTTSLRVTWSSSTDNLSISNYRVDVSAVSNFSSFVHNDLSAGVDAGSTQTFDITTGLSAGTQYWVRVRSVDNGGNTSLNSASASGTTQNPADTQVPVVAITSPTDQLTGVVNAATTNMYGSATDNVGVTQVTWVNNRGGSGTATGFTPGASVSWRIEGAGAIPLQFGANMITVTARDAAGNTGTRTVTLTRNDVTAPTWPALPSIPVVTPMSTTSLQVIWMAATDDVGVTGYLLDVSDNSSFTSTANGGFLGRDVGNTVSYIVTGLPAAPAGRQFWVRVRARDAANNVSAYSSAATTTLPPSDTTNPIVTITAPTSNSTHATTTSSASLSGTAADPESGITTVTWTNDRGGSGTASGTTSWSISSVPLQFGANVITVTARNGADKTGTDTITVIRDTTVPSAPGTPSAGETTLNSITFSWTPSTDNSGGSGVSTYLMDVTDLTTFPSTTNGSFSNRDVGNVTSYTVTGLTAGRTYRVRVRARDGAGNVGTNSGTGIGTTTVTTPPAPANVRIVP